ncbi:MAG: acetyl-CoA carboxylase biotin carboxyl carrier protein [Hyphomonadaceae bacterium]|nr:acetyl-CoA carboxylase biotin carboxyl carrier protein [Hyphomonadaceae bacterium]
MSEKKPGAGLDPEIVRELAAILSESGLSEIEVEHGDLKLRLARTLVAQASAPAPAPMHAYVVPPQAAPAAEPRAEARPNSNAVLSPMVGTAYLSPEPGATVFIRIGDSVTEGQTLLIVEAMKTFNPIPAPRAGKVKEILVTDAQPVEYGQPLIVLE